MDSYKHGEPLFHRDTSSGVGDSQLLGDFMHDWLDALRHKLRISTWTSYRSNIDHHVIPAIGHIPLGKLSPVHLNHLYAELLRTGRVRDSDGLSHRSVRYIHAIISRCLRDAVRWELVSRNVCRLADPPRVPTPATSTWSRAQLAHFLICAREDSLYAAWVLLATTGLRRGEVLGLRREDLDLEAGLIRIRQALIAVSSRIYVSEPKTKKANRQVLLAPQVVDCLRRHYIVGGREEGSGKTEFLFTSGGLPVHPDRFSRRFVSLCRRAELPRIRLHDLRHTFATLALCEGINPKVVSEILGHANISITLETYSHALPSLQREATARVADLVFSREDPSSEVPHGI